MYVYIYIDLLNGSYRFERYIFKKMELAYIYIYIYIYTIICEASTGSHRNKAKKRGKECSVMHMLQFAVVFVDGQ